MTGPGRLAAHSGRRARGAGLAPIGAIAAILALAAAACSSPRAERSPSVHSVALRVAGADPEGMDLVCDVAYENPRSAPVVAPRISCELVAGNAVLASCRDQRAPLVPAGRRGVATVPLRMRFADLPQGGREGADEVPVTVRGTADLHAQGAPMVAEFSRDQALSLVRPPSFRMQGVDTSRLTETGGPISIVGILVNPNGFAVGIEGLRWSLVTTTARMDGIELRMEGDLAPREQRRFLVEVIVSDPDVVAACRDGRVRRRPTALQPSGAMRTPAGSVAVRGAAVDASAAPSR